MELPVAVPPEPESAMSSFSTYLIGFIVLVIGLAFAAYLLGASTVWILAGAIVLIGLGVLMATTQTKPRDPPTAPPR